MENSSILELYQYYIKKEEERAEIQIHGQPQAIFDFCQYTIRTQYEKNSKSKYRFKKRKGSVPEEFIRSFSSMSGPDKMKYYIKNVNYLVRIASGNYTAPQVGSDQIQGIAYSRSKNLKRWKKKNIRLDKEKKILYAERQNKIKSFDLGNYIYRVSKNTDYYSFVIEANNDSVSDSAKTVHFGFKDPAQMKKWGQALQISIDYRHWERLLKAYTGKNQVFTNFYRESHQNSKQKKEETQSAVEVKQFTSKQESEQKAEKIFSGDQTPIFNNSKKESDDSDSPGENIPAECDPSRTIIDSLIESDFDQDIEEIENKDKKEVSSKKNLDLFHKMFPEYQLEELEDENNFEMILNDAGCRILHSTTDYSHYKVFLQFAKNSPKDAIFNALCVPEFIMGYLINIQQMTIKTLISSQNSAIMYQKNKPYNKLYRSRDFVFIRHGFRKDQDFYIVDRKIENTNYPPFMTIVRGDYSSIWGILEKQDYIKVVGDFHISHEGYINEQQQRNLTMIYLKDYLKMSYFCKNKWNQLRQFKLFDIAWNISENKQNIAANKIRLQQKKERKILKQEQAKRMMLNRNSTKNPRPQKVEEKKMEDASMKTVSPFSSLPQNKEIIQEIPEVDPHEQELIYKTAKQIERNFDEKGLVVIKMNCLKAKYFIEPINVKENLYLQGDQNRHPIWKGQWIQDKKEGGILFINQKKIEDQKGVLKFILTKIGKNLLSGKSVLSISLPVDIFSPQSNLELLSYSCAYAPKLLDRAKHKKTLDRFKDVVLFGISTSPLYLNMQKPFNPILGETFQCWINGCPMYAQQISHHPPIGALYFAGRGYRITAQLESKVELHMNSGCGTNDGIFRVRFDDGEEVCFITPGGEVSGLTYGDRKFNMVGKAFYWIEKKNIFVELVYNPSKKGFFSMGKQENPSDYFEGCVVEVKPEFIKKFLKDKKKKGPSDLDILKKLGIISGVWHKYVKFDQDLLINFDIEFPFKLEYEANPLPSDANWRQDIAYRRINQISRAQTEKQRLENLQRQDRKFRQKFAKKK